ncbi:MAG: heat-inducible transcriptional repressor, partial [Halothiobacillaceae bacterium]
MSKQRTPNETNALGISDRAQSLFKALVNSYIRDGQPVGSKVLARDTGLNLSPATIRNVLADLEAQGLIASPHTSAGRVPTTKGYRMFVDSLVTVKPPSASEIASLKDKMAGRKSVDELVDSVSALLSDVTHMAGVVMLPRREYTTLRRIEFLPLSDRQVLAILVISEREVENRIIHTMREYSSAELQEAANFSNHL